MTKVKAALQVLAGIRLFSPTAIIAGGCARDIYHDVEPKDFDIIVPIGGDLKALKEHLMELADPGTYRQFIFADGATGESYSDIDRIILCHKLKAGGVDYDVLLYNVQHYAISALAHFDFNLNQFFLDDEGLPKFGGWPDEHPSFGLYEIRGDARPDRVEYIHAKHKALYPGLY